MRSAGLNLAIHEDRPYIDRRPLMGPNQSTPSARSRILLAATSSWFVISVCYLGLTPAYPDIARDLHVRADEFGALLGISLLVSGILQVPSGVLADRFGLRLFVLVGVLATGVAIALVGGATAPWIFAMSQLAMGVAIPTLQAGSITAVAKAYAGLKQASAISYIWTASSAGLTASLLLFGLVGGRVGWRPVALTLALLPILILPLILRMPALPRSEESKSIARSTLESIAFVFAPGSLPVALVSTLAMTAAISALFLIPFVLREHSLGVAATGVLLLSYVLGSIIGTPIIGHAGDRFGIARPLGVSLLLGGIGLAVFSVFIPSTPVVICCLAVLGAITNGGQALLQSLTADLARALGVGTGAALGGMRLAQSFGPIFGPSLTGFAYLRFGSTATLLAIGAILALAAILSFKVLANVATQATLPRTQLLS